MRKFWIKMHEDNPVSVVWSYYPSDKPAKGEWIEVYETSQNEYLQRIEELNIQCYRQIRMLEIAEICFRDLSELPRVQQAVKELMDIAKLGIA